MIGIVIVIILLLTLILSVTNFFRMRNIKKEQQKSLSLMDLAEFDNLSPKIKEIYKLYVFPVIQGRETNEKPLGRTLKSIPSA